MTTKYDEHGNEYEIVYHHSPNVSLGYAVYRSENSEPRFGDIQLFRFKLYEKPPIQMQHDQIKDLSKLIDDLNDKKRQLAEEVRLHKANLAGRMEEISKYEGLERLEDFLEGRITHFIFKKFGPPVLLTKEDSLRYIDNYVTKSQGLKLLTLFGKANGDLQWRINDYPDGSGASTAVIPCCSYEDAVDSCRPMIAEQETSDRPTKEWVDFAESIGLSMSDNYKNKVSIIQEEVRQNKIKKLKEDLAKLTG